jgi:hypothetical protein
MRYLLASLVIAVAVFAGVALASSGDRAARAQVAVAQTSPVVITGAGFKKGERIALTVSSKSMRTKRIVAGAGGGFRTMFRGFSIARCTEYTVRARGNRGSSAVLRVIPDCPAQRQVETTVDPGLPSDPGAPKKPH